MFSFLRAPLPPRTNNTENNPIIYEAGRSSVTFAAPGSDYIMTHRIPPTTKEHGISIIEPPFHYHIYQDEFFHVQSGKGRFFRGVDPKPFAVLSGEPGGQATASVKAGRYHRFENASETEDLVVDIHLTPESYESEQRFFRNFFGYLDDCKTAGTPPSFFQLMVFLHSADTPFAVSLPWEWMGKMASRLLLWTVAYWGRFVLGYKQNYPEYYEEGKTNPSSPSFAEEIPHRPGRWIIYIHGGAWRDPLVDSSSFESAALNILAAKHTTPVAGIASLNYPLSSHPNHPTHPAPPRDPSQPIDIAGTAKHPDHILAVLSALAYLQRDLGVAHDYILSGHSCGATLAFQVAMDSQRWAGIGNKEQVIPIIKKPSVIVGLNGLYNLAHFINQPDESHAALVPVYDAFTRGAFGDDEQVWQQVCPTDVEDWAKEWPEGKTVVVVQSREDGLVPYSQTELMKMRLSETSKLEVKELDAGGDHNDLWKQGDSLAEIMLEVLESSTKHD
ncbi:Kynurenine formamidase [Tolypocladium paradoxum]|uniref:Kynurenine formamidase n=1 Tax=Tolypocladium paradoxum TaxID=94208 RepID=A0A2S4L8Y8_9HYPO|nr:Kynurenine formamidase [Tolypocladium paradoxum]